MILYNDGRAVPPVMLYCTACPGKGPLSCEHLVIPAAAAGINCTLCTQNTDITLMTQDRQEPTLYL